MKPRRLHSATIFSIVTMSCAGGLFGSAMRNRLALSRLGPRRISTRPARGRHAPGEVGVEQASGFRLVCGHEMTVAVERDRDRCVAHVGAERLPVDAGGDHKRAERVPRLMQPEAVELRVLECRRPAYISAPTALEPRPS